MEIVALNVEKRESKGKGAARRSRAKGRVPGVFYGPRQEAATPLELDRIEFSKKVGSLEGQHLIQLKSESPDLGDKMVLLREVQNHPVTGHVLHADFYEVDLTQKLEVEVALHFVGKAAGADLGGILQPVRREITVLCLPTQIPDYIEVDVSPLGIHDSIHIEDVAMPEGVEAVYDENYTVVTVLSPTVEEVPTAAAAAEGEVAPAAEGAEAKPAEGKKGEE